MPKLIDISLPISAEMPTWPGSPPVSLSRFQPDADSSIIETVLHFNAHTGTHIDAPRHFLPGAATVSQIPLDVLLGPAQVAWLPEVDKITSKEINALSIPKDTRRLLLRTRNSDHWAVQPAKFDRNFVALTPDAAEWVVDHAIQLLGVDAYPCNVSVTGRRLIGFYWRRESLSWKAWPYRRFRLANMS